LEEEIVEIIDFSFRQFAELLGQQTESSPGMKKAKKNRSVVDGWEKDQGRKGFRNQRTDCGESDPKAEQACHSV